LFLSSLVLLATLPCPQQLLRVRRAGHRRLRLLFRPDHAAAGLGHVFATAAARPLIYWSEPEA
jgi:hypothetical protein